MLCSTLFSVIIPVYNVQNYLDECISSVLAQNHQNYEIILVNDSSSDESLNICLKYTLKYPQRIILLSKPNGGLSDARNYGMKIAKGKYILFLDSDDLWDGNNILSDLEEIIKTNRLPDVVLHTFRFIDEEGKEVLCNNFDQTNLSGDFRTDFIKLQERRIYRSNCWTKVIKRKIVLDNPFPVGLNYEDSDYSFNLSINIHSYALYNSDFYLYRVRRKSISYCPTLEKAMDLLRIIERNLYKLNEVRYIDTSLYIGLRNYLKDELSYIENYIINRLNSEEKPLISTLFNKCSTVLSLSA